MTQDRLDRDREQEAEDQAGHDTNAADTRHGSGMDLLYAVEIVVMRQAAMPLLRTDDEQADEKTARQRRQPKHYKLIFRHLHFPVHSQGTPDAFLLANDNCSVTPLNQLRIQRAI